MTCPPLLTPRWTSLRPHPTQRALWESTARFRVVPAGRRSGKTELAKRFVVKAAMIGNATLDARYFCGAPTRDQAKRIYWNDLKALIPEALRSCRPSESELTVRLFNGSAITVIGMDKPERIEGTPWDGGILDEYANMKAQAWVANVRPALSDRRGWCWLIGVPEGRNHYYETYLRARSDETGEWAAFSWPSADILPKEEIDAARFDLDELTFDQEYNASFVTFEGRAYYPFDEKTHVARLSYNPKAPLIVCFDFNVAPGVAAICQEQGLPSGEYGTGVIGEVWIPRNSNTPAVCRKIVADYGAHEGAVLVYGDATGGARGSAKVCGSDWDLIRDEFRPAFGNRVRYEVPKANPPERSRINAVNSRIKNHGGQVRLMVDGVKAPNVVRDLEGVRLLTGGSGEIDKRADPNLSHISDALGYYIVAEFPTTKRENRPFKPFG